MENDERINYVIGCDALGDLVAGDALLHTKLLVRHTTASYDAATVRARGYLNNDSKVKFNQKMNSTTKTCTLRAIDFG